MELDNTAVPLRRFADFRVEQFQMKWIKKLIEE